MGARVRFVKDRKEHAESRNGRVCQNQNKDGLRPPGGTSDNPREAKKALMERGGEIERGMESGG